MKQISDIVEVPTDTPKSQIISALDNKLANGWELKGIWPFASKTWAVFTKTIVSK